MKSDRKWLCQISAHAWTLGYIAVVTTVILVILVLTH